ncbi:PIN domain-containing protein [Thauera sp.]|uniref:PIN domain-containing protein n=1 Tax=Thauera sp. TaxID=1905334 RepID=UPI002CEC6DC0|nr:PIN domain-containing protein [Thauera sp.]HRP22410.1 PIN domain-containing protein [Thauera sp.]
MKNTAPDSSRAEANSPLHLVLDTNTVLALWMFRDPVLDGLRRWIESTRPSLFAREDTLAELAAVLGYAHFGQTGSAQAALLADYRDRVHCLPTSATEVALPACKDPDDQKFLELAWQANASHLLTRDRALLAMARKREIRDRFRILSPESFSALHAL